MNKISQISLRQFLIFMVSFCFTIAYGQEINDYETIKYEVDSLLNTPYTAKVYKKKIVRRRGRRRTVRYAVEVKRTFDVGCCIYDLKGDSVLYEHNATKMMIPASTQKLYVAATMLTNKNANFAFSTSLVSDGELHTDSLGRPYWDGDFHIKYDNDPSFTSEDARTLARNLLTLGFDSINGKILMRVSDKNRKGIETGNKWAKAIAVHLKDQGLRFTDSQSWGVVRDEMNVANNPYRQTVDDIRQLNRMERVYAVKTTPLLDVLQRMLKNSNNAYAESVLVNVLDDETPWSYDNCRNAVSQLVTRIKTHYYPNEESSVSDYYKIIDGSGLSHSNRTTAQSQVDLLRYIYHNKNIYPIVYEALPVAGVDGTLSKRMKGSNSFETVRAKTGTLSNVYTLTGYAKMANGTPIAFSILINNCYDSSFSRGLQDSICDAITNIH